MLQQIDKDTVELKRGGRWENLLGRRREMLKSGRRGVTAAIDGDDLLVAAPG